MKVALADVLWDAANERLYDGHGQLPDSKEGYSCAAVASATGGLWLPAGIREFLEGLGCKTLRDDLLHKPWAFTPEYQGVRYMWLLLSMHVAADEGIEIEVEA